MTDTAEAVEALGAWGGSSHPPRLIKDRENAVFEVRLNDGRRAALRLHRIGYQSAAAISSELWWMQEVAKRGVPVPTPISTDDGALSYVLANGRVATLISWVEGKQLGEQGTELSGSESEQEVQFGRIGALVADLHNATDALDLPPEFERHSWDSDGFLGNDPFWGRFWENPTLCPDEQRLLQDARETARARLAAFDDAGGDYGLIHADVLRENVFFRDGDPVLIDFDDCGFGYRLYDLASLASQNEDLPNYPALMQAAITGYRGRRSLPDAAVAELEMFVMLRRFASCGWIVSRADEDRRRIYAQRAVRAARQFLR